MKEGNTKSNIKKLTKSNRTFPAPKPVNKIKYCKCKLDFIPCSKDWDKCDICGGVII